MYFNFVLVFVVYFGVIIFYMKFDVIKEKDLKNVLVIFCIGVILKLIFVIIKMVNIEKNNKYFLFWLVLLYLILSIFCFFIYNFIVKI